VSEGTKYHLYGTRQKAKTTLPFAEIAHTAGTSMSVADMGLYTILFETSMEAALHYLPPSLHPSVPALMSITFYQAAESPLGAFNLAVIGLGCRSGTKPRMLTLSAFADTDAACNFFRSEFGYPVRKAVVKTGTVADSITGSIALENNIILDVVTNDPIDIVGSGATLKIWGALNPVQTDTGSYLIQTETDYTFKTLQRGKPLINKYEQVALSSPDIFPTWPVMGSLATVDIDFKPTRYLLDVLKAAESGGVTNLATYEDKSQP
jgi:hypothetical protein